MAKRYNIRWQESDEQELRRAVKNFNAKISRLAKKEGYNEYILPEKASYKELRDLIGTRQDLKRELNSLKRFSQKGAEKIVTAPDNNYDMKLTSWEKKEMQMRARIVTQRRQKKLDELNTEEMTSRGEKLGYTQQQFGMGRIEALQFRPTKAFTPSMNRPDLRAKHKSLLLESQSDYYNKQDEIMRENFIKGLETSFYKKDIGDVINAIKKMDIKTFMRIARAEGGSAIFEIASPPGVIRKRANKQSFRNDIEEMRRREYEAYVEGLKSTWLPKKKKTTKKNK